MNPKLLTVPSKTFNAGLDKWINISLGIPPRKGYYGYCSYCDRYRDGDTHLSMECASCPLSSPDPLPSDTPDSVCCGGLWEKFYDLMALNEFRLLTPKARAVADQIVDYILAHCVYEDRDYVLEYCAYEERD